MNDHINFKKINETGIVNLNNPKALNALDLNMAEKFFNKLLDWKSDPTLKRILLKGKGKAFCAGGDVKSLFFSSNKNNLKKKFLYKEYILNYAISEFNKPYLSIWNGMVMGGGVGLSIYGNARIASENAKFAMPETAIGFFPDVGGSYFLSRIDKGIGLFLGLTGQVLNTTEMLAFKLATHYQPSNNLDSMEKNYIKNGNILESNILPNEQSVLLKNINFIEDTFFGDLLSIIERLKNSKIEFSQYILNNLLCRCPMSLAVTTELIKKAEKLSLKDCLKMEYQLSQHIVYRKDFNEGINNVLVSKKHKPKWNPSKISDINFNEVENLFIPHVSHLNI